MPDPITALTFAIETAKRVSEIAKKIEHSEISNLIADLNLKLAELKNQVAALQEENLELRDEIKRAKTAEDLRDKLELRNGLYFLKEQMEGLPGGPYCVRCYDADHKLILVSSLPSVFSHMAQYECPECEKHY